VLPSQRSLSGVALLTQLSQREPGALAAVLMVAVALQGECAEEFLRNHKQIVISCQHARHISARNEVGSKRKEVAPPSRKEEVCICMKSESGICVFGIAVEVSRLM